MQFVPSAAMQVSHVLVNSFVAYCMSGLNGHIHSSFPTAVLYAECSSGISYSSSLLGGLLLLVVVNAFVFSCILYNFSKVS
eukprot:2672700-Amphidinium_carterae.2